MVYPFSVENVFNPLSKLNLTQLKLKTKSAKLNNLYSHPLEVVSRFVRDPQLQAGENYSQLFDLRPIICKSLCLSSHLVPNHNRNLVG